MGCTGIPRYPGVYLWHTSRREVFRRERARHNIDCIATVQSMPSWDNRRATGVAPIREAHITPHAILLKWNCFLIASVKPSKHGKSTIHSFASSSCCRLSRSWSSLELQRERCCRNLHTQLLPMLLNCLFLFKINVLPRLFVLAVLFLLRL